MNQDLETPSSGHSTSRGNNPHRESEAISALLELREFIANELDPATGSEKLGRTVRPLTDGLGLESPRPGTQNKFSERPISEARELPYEIRDSRAAQEAVPKKKVVQPPALPPQTFIPSEATENRAAAHVLAQVIEPPKEISVKKSSHKKVSPSFLGENEVTIQEISQETNHLRPETEVSEPRETIEEIRVSLFRRVMAAVMDEIFVWTVFLLALFLTVKFVLGGGADLTTANLHTLNNPILIRFAWLEFATLWLCYFAVTFGILDMTFGMWVWNFRIRYSEEDGGSLLARKAFRVLLSFLFYAPVVPLFLLALQRRGRNLLDWLSGTKTYRTVT